LTTLAIGVQQVVPAENPLILLASVVLGGIIGELLRIEHGLERLGDLAQAAFDRAGREPEARANAPGFASEDAAEPSVAPVATASQVSRGFVTASLIFCVGPMTILGSFQDGLTGAYQTLALKATLDGFTAALLASTLGWGVLLSAATVLLYQGALTLGAALLRGVLTDPMIAAMTATGGLLIVGIGLNILEIARIRVGSMLPALVVAPVLTALTR
jgi:uncharacterized membrane protein YqgA involved in biofilm formation